MSIVGNMGIQSKAVRYGIGALGAFLISGIVHESGEYYASALLSFNFQTVTDDVDFSCFPCPQSMMLLLGYHTIGLFETHASSCFRPLLWWSKTLLPLIQAVK